MKSNAITRIIIYSLVVVLLLGVLLSGLKIGKFTIEFSNDWDSVNAIEASEGSVSAEKIRNLNIEWVDGEIDIITVDTDAITFRETGFAAEDDRMVWDENGDTLTIRYSKPTFRIGFFSLPSKNLEIVVPKDWACENLELTTVSGRVNVQDIAAEEIDLESTSAVCSLRNVTAEDVSLGTVSGDLNYAGTLKTLKCESVSAKCTAELLSQAHSIDTDSVSGDLILILHDFTGFTASVDSVSGTCVSAFGTVSNGNSQVYGDGACRITANSVSGSVRIESPDA